MQTYLHAGLEKPKSLKLNTARSVRTFLRGTSDDAVDQWRNARLVVAAEKSAESKQTARWWKEIHLKECSNLKLPSFAIVLIQRFPVPEAAARALYILAFLALVCTIDSSADDWIDRESAAEYAREARTIFLRKSERIIIYCRAWHCVRGANFGDNEWRTEYADAQDWLRVNWETFLQWIFRNRELTYAIVALTEWTKCNQSFRFVLQVQSTSCPARCRKRPTRWKELRSLHGTKSSQSNDVSSLLLFISLQYISLWPTGFLKYIHLNSYESY